MPDPSKFTPQLDGKPKSIKITQFQLNNPIFSLFNPNPTHLYQIKTPNQAPAIPIHFLRFPAKHHQNNLQTTTWNHH